MKKLTGKQADTFNKLAAKINISQSRDVVPCVRVNPDGSTTIIDCKTGKPKAQ